MSFILSKLDLFVDEQRLYEYKGSYESLGIAEGKEKT